MASFCLGDSEHDSVVVMIHSYERTITGEYYDDNWLAVEVKLSAGAFSGHFTASFLTEEIVRFQISLQSLYDSLKGEALFSTLENQLSLRVIGNGRGEIEVKGVALDMPGDGNKVEFQLSIDQTHLAITLRELNVINSLFPVRNA